MFDTLLTIRDFIRYAVTQFRKNNLYFGHGSTNAYDEAVCLVLQSLSLPLDQLEPYLDAKLLPDEAQIILELINKRVTTRMPLAYITNEAFLQGFSFYVDRRVIIPRSFIAEHIIHGQLDEWVEQRELVHNILDLGTGNGSLATIAAHYYYDAKLVASDIDDAALEVAAINFERNQVKQQITLVKSDLFNNLANYSQTFDLILSNPPYVDDKRMANLPKEYAYEPRIALAGGKSGLDFVDKILHQAKYYLADFGVLVVEMGDNCNELEALYPDLPFTWLDSISGDGVVFVLRKADLQDYFD